MTPVKVRGRVQRAYYVNVHMRSFDPQTALFMLTVERLASSEVRPVCFNSDKNQICGILVGLSLISGNRCPIHLILPLSANIYAEVRVF